MSPWRRIVWGAVGIVGAVGVGVLAWKSGTTDLQEHLLEDARIVYGPRQRATHVGKPIPGSFGERLLQAAPALKESQAEYERLGAEVDQVCKAVGQGTRPFSDLPAPCKALVKRYRAPFSTVLEGTHAESPELPPVFNPLHVEFWRPDAPGFGIPAYAARLVALDIRARLAEPGQEGEAVSECIDGLAVSRDLTYSDATIPFLSGAAVADALTPACAAALDSAPADDKKPAVEQLRLIRDAIRPFEAALRGEAVFSDLAFAHVALRPRELKVLPPAAVALAREGPVHLDFWENLFAVWGWRAFDRVHQRWFQAMAMPRRSRLAELKQIEEDAARSANPFTRQVFGMSRYYGRYLRMLDRFDLLAAVVASDVFRGEHGRWPTAGEIHEQLPGTDPNEIQAEPSGDGLRLSLPEDPSGEVSVLVTPDPEPAAPGRVDVE